MTFQPAPGFAGLDNITSALFNNLFERGGSLGTLALLAGFVPYWLVKDSRKNQPG